MDEILKSIAGMDIEDALAKITKVLRKLLADMDNNVRERFLMNLIGQSEGGNLSSLVHL